MKKEAILVVEDEDILRDALVDWFTSEDHPVDGVSDAEQALNRLGERAYEVAIVDLKLPGRDGLSVLRDVKSKDPATKVVIITAYPSVETAVEAMKLGAVDYLPKPFELERLAEVIRRPLPATVPPQVVEEVPAEEKPLTLCIWAQAGIVPKRVCPYGYRCTSECSFHTSMMAKERFRNDERIAPYLEQLNALTGRNQCRYTLSGQIAFRSCPKLYHCESCEFHQIFQDQVETRLPFRPRRSEKRART